jgi:hypothetical protein
MRCNRMPQRLSKVDSPETQQVRTEPKAVMEVLIKSD